MAFLAGVLFYLRSDLYINGIHISLITGLVYATVVGSAAALVCLFLPSMRFMIEAIAVSRVCLALLVLSMPNLGYAIISSPLMTAFIVVLGGSLISRVMHGRIERKRKLSLLPSGGFFNRSPVRTRGNEWQRRFVHWLDDTAPIRV